jgi:hypothetical protein
MATMEDAKAQDKKVQGHDVENQHQFDYEASSIGKGDILQLEHTDPVLNAKMHLVNNAIDEIGFTSTTAQDETVILTDSHQDTNGNCSS